MWRALHRTLWLTLFGPLNSTKVNARIGRYAAVGVLVLFSVRPSAGRGLFELDQVTGLVTVLLVGHLFMCQLRVWSHCVADTGLHQFSCSMRRFLSEMSRDDCYDCRSYRLTAQPNTTQQANYSANHRTNGLIDTQGSSLRRLLLHILCTGSEQIAPLVGPTVAHAATVRAQ